MKNAFFNRMNYFFAAVCIFCSICFFSCMNPVSSLDYDSDDNGNLYEIKGNLLVDGSSPKIMEKTGQDRSASAKVPDGIFYSVSAKNAENSEKTYTAEVDGSTFLIKLSKGTWNITAEGFSDAEKTISVLKGSAEVSVDDENSVKSGISVKMLPQTGGKGNISLSVEIESGSGIKSVSAELKKNGESGSVYSENLNFGGNAAKIEKSDVSSGVYVLSLKFYSESDCAGELFYSAEEVVNVFNNLTTDSWQGNSVYFNGGKFIVSKSAVENFKMKTFFVQGESETTYSPVSAADDSNAGTYFAPLKTVQSAVDKINSLNDGNTDYTILVDGMVTADTIYGNYSENNSSFVNISPASTLNLSIKSLSSEKAVIDGGRSSKSADTTGWRVFYIGSKANVAFENITITGGSLNDTGGGIYAEGNLSLKNCVVEKNKSNNFGGGISFSGKELLLENTSVVGNKSSSSGGGICADGKVTISDSQVLSNSADDNGGGIYFGDGEKTISDTTVNKNSAEFGGGIYMQGGTLNLESGAVIGEELNPDDVANGISKVATEKDYGNRSTKQISPSSTEHDVGAGIFLWSGTLNMEDGAYICRNYTSCAGGGIFIKSGTFNMKGGTVGWNRSNYGGGIFCKGELNVSGNSKICYNKVSTLYVQGFCGRGGGIAVNENCIAIISENTKIFGNQAVKWSSDSNAPNQDALGAGIYCASTLKIGGGEIYENSTESDGAAIALENGTAILSDCKIMNNSAGRNGGAVFISTTNTDKESSLTVKENVSIASNHADGSGGAFYATINTKDAAGKCSYVTIGENKNSENIEIAGNFAGSRGGAFYGADNARFVMNAGKVSENYSSGSGSGNGGGAIFIWGGSSTYSTFSMSGGKISGNMAKNGGAGGAVHIDHGSGGMASFIMTGGVLSGNKAADENGDGSKLGGAIYVNYGGEIKLRGSAVIAVEDDGNDIWLAAGRKITVTDALAPENNDSAGNPKYTARITPKSYVLGTALITADSGVTLKDEVGKFCVTDESDSSKGWFITEAGSLSK